jgi:hypothetical protein
VTYYGGGGGGGSTGGAVTGRPFLMDELLRDIAKKLKADEKGEKDKDKEEKKKEENDDEIPKERKL